MQWTAGAVRATSSIKGVGDLLGKLVKGAVTKESAVKPEYTGTGLLVLEPTYKFIVLQEVSEWGCGMTVEDGMFLACEGTVQRNITARSNISSAVAGGEGLFNTTLTGPGKIWLQTMPLSNVAGVLRPYMPTGA